ncbi:MAG TPA: nitrous oxide reductase family maturation protein NosD [Labilithrix sp.]|nr:nitrous oxide reductase family maturation protein NosD [Labilithrix sp.]
MSRARPRACLATIAVIAAPLVVFGVRVAAASSAGHAGPDHASAPAVARVLPNVGPRERHAAPGAVVARTSEELAAFVRDEDGPREIELLPQVYRGDLTIKRPVTIRGERLTVLEGSGSSTVVTVDAKDVTLENVLIRHSGRRHTAEDSGVKAKGERIRVADVDIQDTLFGVSLEACKQCVVERAHVVGFGDEAELRGDGIKLWEANDSVVRGCLVEHARDLVVWYTRRATVEDTVVTGGRYGAHFMYAHDSVVRRSHFERNVVGIFVMYSMRLRVEENVLAGARGAAGIGLGFKDSDAVQVRGNWLVANTVGTYLDNTPRTAADPVGFDDNLFALNDVAMRLNTSEAGLSFRGNDFHQNAEMIEVDGGGDAMFVAMRGNHYSDYEGYDLDADGVGDVAYEVKALSSELTESRPSLKLFHGTAALGLVDAVARAMPMLASHKLLVDPAPLARRPGLTMPAPRLP